MNHFNIDIPYKYHFSKKLKKYLYKLYKICLKEMLRDNKVAFLYKSINKNYTFSFNENICFYAASTIKILVTIIILKKNDISKLDLNKKILIKMSDLKQDTGIIKYQKQDTYYTIKELIVKNIIYSDNTAYIKLVNFIGKDNIKTYGKNLGAKYTMETTNNDLFGLINCNDMYLYWQDIYKYIGQNNKNSLFLKKLLLNPKVKIIKQKHYVRKYGSYDIAYHEAGYIDIKAPYYLIVLTQLNKKWYKRFYVNKIAKIIKKINKII